MSNLLDVTRLTKMSVPKKGTLMALECEVSPDTAPYLVTSSKGLTWVPNASIENKVTAAVRLRCHPEMFFADVVEAVHEAGQTWEWGNVLPLSPEGLQTALDYIRAYDLGDVEILVPTGQGSGRVVTGFASDMDYATRPCSWLPQDLAVIVPKDRGFVGLVYRVTGQDLVGLVHNAARGMAILSNRPRKSSIHEADVAE